MPKHRYGVGISISTSKDTVTTITGESSHMESFVNRKPQWFDNTAPGSLVRMHMTWCMVRMLEESEARFEEHCRPLLQSAEGLVLHVERLGYAEDGQIRRRTLMLSKCNNDRQIRRRTLMLSKSNNDRQIRRRTVMLSKCNNDRRWYEGGRWCYQSVTTTGVDTKEDGDVIKV